MPLDKIAVALRVLNAIKRSAPPTQTDLDTLKAWIPLDDRVLPPDGIARLVMNRELAHTKINYH